MCTSAVCCCLVTRSVPKHCCNNSKAVVLFSFRHLHSSLRCTLRSCTQRPWLIMIRRVTSSLVSCFLSFFFFLFVTSLGPVSMLSSWLLPPSSPSLRFLCFQMLTMVLSRDVYFRPANVRFDLRMDCASIFFFTVLAYFVILSSSLPFRKSVGSFLQFLFYVYKFSLCHGCHFSETLFIFRTASVFLKSRLAWRKLLPRFDHVSRRR